MKSEAFTIALPEIEPLTASEMFAVRGGSTPIKPKSRPRDVYDDED